MWMPLNSTNPWADQFRYNLFAKFFKKTLSSQRHGKLMQKILIVGQCDFDYQRISFVISKMYAAEIHRADLFDDAIQQALEQPYALILINRLLDLDRSEGMEILHELKSNPRTDDIPVMIISNYQDAQDIAVAAGASPGFGKAALDTPRTFELLSNYLAPKQS